MSNRAIQPMGRHGNMNGGAAGRGAKSPMKTLKRLLAYTFSRNKVATVFVVFFVLLSAGTSSLGASFFAPIIKELINGVPNGMWAVYKNIIIIGCIYIVGGLSSFAYNRIMMYVAQGRNV